MSKAIYKNSITMWYTAKINMTFFAVYFSFILLILNFSVLNAEGVRTWTDKQGRQIQGELISRDDTIVKIKINAKEFEIPIDTLSSKDQDYILKTNFDNTSIANETLLKNKNSSSISAVRSIEDGINELVSELGSKLNRGTSVGVTRFYLNGSGSGSKSSYFFNKLLSELLKQGNFEVFDRSDILVVMEEGRLEYLSQGTSQTNLTSSDAIIVGDLLYSDTCSQAFLAIRVILTANSEVLFTGTRKVQINNENMERLGIAYRNILDEHLPLLKSESENDYIESLKMASQKVDSFSLVSSSRTSTKTSILERIGYFRALEIAISINKIIYDRDLLLSLFEESNADFEKTVNLDFGEAIISIATVNLSETNPLLPIKIHHRENGMLLGISNLIFSEGANSDIDTPWNDSFSSVRQHIRNITAFDPAFLKSETTFILKNYTASKEYFLTMLNDYKYESFKFTYFKEGKLRVGGRQMFYWDEHDGASKIPNEYSLIKCFNYYSKIIVHTTDDELNFRRNLVSLVILGVEHNDFLLPGLWLNLFFKLSQNVTPEEDGEAVYRMWLEALCSFAHQWATSEKIMPHEGTFSYEKIKFNYTIDYRFDGIYPARVSLKIDLTPMKNNLYTVIKNEISYN